MIEIITIANQKGGVGKTTTAVNLAASLAVAEKRVLLIDMDPQGNATTGFGYMRSSFEYSIYHVLTNKKKISEVILKTSLPKLDLVPSSINLVSFDKELSGVNDIRLSLSINLKNIIELYDYIIIDTPPSIGNITINALSASTSVIIPIQCEFYALEGVALILSSIDKVKKTLNSKLKVMGFLPTMYSSNNNLSKETLLDLKKFLSDQLFKFENEIILIPRNVKLAESPSFGKPVILYDIKSSGSIAYQKLANSVIGFSK